MATCIARSMSRSVKKQLFDGEFVAQVLGVFERACDLVTPDGNVVALVVPQIGNGPLNIVVDSSAGLFAGIKVRAPVTLAEGHLYFGGGRVDLTDAAVWNPQPDWNAFRARQATIVSCLPRLRALSHHHAPGSTLLALLDTPLPGDSIVLAAHRAGAVLLDGWQGNQQQLQLAGIGLAGLGRGLTPAGDDFLAGVMLWAWLAHSTPANFCQSLLDAAAPRTTTLSAAFLRAAAQGECSSAWHTLLAALSNGSDVEIMAAAKKVLAYGATSGADTLAGFLYLPTFIPLSPRQPLPDTRSRR